MNKTPKPKNPLRRSTSTTLNCFSPPIMLATCLIELSLFIYTLLRYKLSSLTRVAAALLLLLAVFQFAEFNVCGHSSLTAATWSRVGFVAITLLPALAINLIQLIARYKNRLISLLAYGSSLFFALVFGLSPQAFQGHVCAGNYAIFQLSNGVGSSYFVYYYFWLLFGIGLCLFLMAKAKPMIKKALVFQVAGYLSFLLPTGIVNMLNPTTLQGIPSIMCGFAVIYALCLSFGIIPYSQQQKD